MDLLLISLLQIERMIFKQIVSEYKKRSVDLRILSMGLGAIDSNSVAVSLLKATMLTITRTKIKNCIPYTLFKEKRNSQSGKISLETGFIRS